MKEKNLRNKNGGTSWKKDWKHNKVLYLLFLPVLIYFIFFHYVPMAGILMAFQKYNIRRGIFGSTWVGLAQFQKFFASPYAGRLIRNTFLIGLYGILISYPLPVVFALLLNEIQHKWFKKTIQTISYLPYFISVVVVVSILNDFCKDSGVLTNIARAFGWQGGALISAPEWFRSLYIGSNVWQHLGYNAIIYISALTTIDPQLYEAAEIDGANRWQQTLHITLPGLSTTMAIMLILRVGQIMSTGYEKIILMYGPATYETGDVISSYVYRVGMQQADYSYSTAINLFNSLINLVLLALANFISKKLSDTKLF